MKVISVAFFKLSNDKEPVKEWILSLDKRIARVLFTVYKSQMVLLHGFVKKSQKTPTNDLNKAKERRDLILGGKK